MVFIYSPQMLSGLADDNNLPGNPHPVVCGNVAPDEPPIRGEAAEGETHTSSHNIKNNLNTMHGQPRTWVISTILAALAGSLISPWTCWDPTVPMFFIKEWGMKR